MNSIDFCKQNERNSGKNSSSSSLTTPSLHKKRYQNLYFLTALFSLLAPQGQLEPFTAKDLIDGQATPVARRGEVAMIRPGA